MAVWRFYMVVIAAAQVQVYALPEQKWLSPIVAPQGEKINQVTLSTDGRLAFFITNVCCGSREVPVYGVAGAKMSYRRSWRRRERKLIRLH